MEGDNEGERGSEREMGREREREREREAGSSWVGVGIVWQRDYLKSS